MPRGGYRPGSGRPKGSGKGKVTPANVAPPAASTQPVAGGDKADGEKPTITPLDYMLGVINDPNADAARKDRLAIAAAPFAHAKSPEVGKKGQRQTAAESAAAGKFSPTAPPRLVVVNK